MVVEVYRKLTAHIALLTGGKPLTRLLSRVKLFVV